MQEFSAELMHSAHWQVIPFEMGTNRQSDLHTWKMPFCDWCTINGKKRYYQAKKKAFFPLCFQAKPWLQLDTHIKYI